MDVSWYGAMLISSAAFPPLRHCSHHQRREAPPAAESAPTETVTLSAPVASSPEALVKTGLKSGLLALASMGVWHDAAVCPICMFDGACQKELGHSGQHVCNQGHRWG